MSRALQLQRSLPRYAAARALSGRLPSAAIGAGPLRLVERREQALPGDGWLRLAPRLAGICGSDLATVTGRSSLYFSPLVSFPFTPGHEVVADVVDGADDLPAGSRVVLDPVLGCAPRGLPLCAACAGGARQRCERVTLGHLAPGLQTGFCADVGGGWARTLVAHRSQLHVVPAELPDERAVLVEPLACAVHVARRAEITDGAAVLLVGAGSVGLLTLLALRALTPAGRITVVARHPRQQELARAFGADEVVPGEAVGAVRRQTGAVRLHPERGADFLLGGVDVAIDAAGTGSSLQTCVRLTRGGGRVVLAGMPHGGSTDLTPLWFQELSLVGAYATGGEDFADAIGLAASAPLGGLVTQPYPLSGWRDALDTAMSAGRQGVVKVVFDPREG